ncbi:hypothetical protein D3P09_15920 [Paenibacillus pinisoli]|uniref:6-bladed beta-propeller n=1 Tax=Paenibacillus pinisoli TaxID=1276110 RepID=A0A3A6PCA3_9BACL|nr:S-layer homology domain-containing protein [Paenibacillus pinisoli]RJX38992.1 hypothetical protein D3P09_15920 [Paenibacillus pinisoli]
MITSLLPEWLEGKVYAAGTYKIDTVAGTGAGGFSEDGGPAISATLNNPGGVAVDSDGNIYIADSANHRVRKVDATGTISTIAGTGTAGYTGDGGPATLAQLNNPYRLALDSVGNLYIVDYSNDCIRMVDVSGEISTVAGGRGNGYMGDGGPATSARLSYPDGVAVDSIGNLYIADKGNHRIRKVDTSGTISTVAGSGVRGYSGDGGDAELAQLNSPTGVAADGSGNLYISDTANHRIRKVDIAGKISTIAGVGEMNYWGDGVPATSAYLNRPIGIAADSGGNVYFVDYSNFRIRKIDTSGIVSTIAGAGRFGYSGDGGPATSAELHGPYEAAVDSSGNLYIAEVFSHRIRKISLSAQTVVAFAASSIPGVGVDNTITLTVKDENGNTDTQFNGEREVTISGYLQAPDNSYGRLNGTALLESAHTASIAFAKGKATVNLALNKAEAQTINLSVEGVLSPAANSLIITPVAGKAAAMSLTTDMEAPASNGGQFAQQPVITLLDAYGNKSAGDNSTVVTASKKDKGAWTLTGTATARASAGVVTFAGLGAANGVVVTEAKLSFETEGLPPVESTTMTLPIYTGKLITQLQPVPHDPDHPHVGDDSRKFKKMDSNVYLTNEPYADLLFTTKGADGLSIFVDDIRKGISARGPSGNLDVKDGAEWLKIDSADPLMDTSMFRLASQPVPATGIRIDISANKTTGDDLESVVLLQAPTVISLDAPHILETGKTITINGHIDTKARLPITISTIQETINDYTDDQGQFSFVYTAPLSAVNEFIVVAAPGVEQQLLKSWGVIIYKPDRLPAPDGLKATAGDGEVVLSWEPVEGATYYDIFEGEASGSYQKTERITNFTGDYTFRGLTNNITRYYVVKAGNDETESDYSEEVSATPQALSPSVPPQWPDGSELKALDITQTSMKLSWPTATDNVGVTGYRIYVNGTIHETVVGSVNVTTVEGLSADTAYTVKVIAFNAEGKESNALTVSARTLPQPPDPDTEAPQWPDGSEMKASDITQTSVKLSWPTATDNVGVIGYRLYVNGTEHETVVGSVHTTTIDRLTAGTTYTVTVAAYDLAGNESATIAIQVTTARSSSGGSGGGPVLSNNADVEELQIWAMDGELVLTPAGTNRYTARTAAEQIDIAVKAAHFAAKVLLQDKEITERTKVKLEAGDNTIVLIVQAENGDRIEYTLSIYREILNPSEPVTHFTDIAGHWAEDDIKRAVEKGIVSGYPDHTFRPGHHVTRAEFTVMLAGALKLEENRLPMSFSDNELIEDWATKAVAQVAQAGIINGYADGSFRPNASITRSEMAVMIERALQLPIDVTASTSFDDDAAIPQWAKGSIEAIRTLGIVDGRGGNHFVPNETATRVEAIVMLLRMLGQLKEE